jgi:hypothetical protein
VVVVEEEEASWWRPWLLLLLLLLARVAMGKEERTNSAEALRVESGSLKVGSNTLLSPPPRLPPPVGGGGAAAAAPTPWNEFCNNESVEHDTVLEVKMRVVDSRNSFVLALLLIFRAEASGESKCLLLAYSSCGGRGLELHGSVFLVM